MVSSGSILSWISRYLLPYRAHVATLAALSLAEVALRVTSPWPLKAVVDHVIGSAPAPAWLTAALAPPSGSRPESFPHEARSSGLVSCQMI